MFAKGTLSLTQLFLHLFQSLYLIQWRLRRAHFSPRKRRDQKMTTKTPSWFLAWQESGLGTRLKTAGIGGNHGRIRIILLLFCSEFVFDRELHFENKLRAINMPYVLISAQIRLVRTSLVNKIASDSALKSLELIMLFKFIYWPLFLTYSSHVHCLYLCCHSGHWTNNVWWRMGRSRSDEVFERRADTHFWE